MSQTNPANVARSDWVLYKRLLGYARPYWRVALVSVLAMVVSASLEPLFPALMRPLIDESLIAKDAQSIWLIPVLIVALFFSKGVADYLGSLASQLLAQKTVADLRSAVFAHELDLGLRAHRESESGRMLTRITFDAATVGEAVSSVWLIVIRDTLVLIGLVGFLFYTAWQLALLVLLIAPILALVIRLTNRLLRRASQSIQGRMGSLSALVQESLLGLQELKIFGAHWSVQQRFDRANKALRHDQMRAARVSSLNVPMVQVLAASCVALVIYVASSLSAENQLTPGEFVAFITAMSMVFEPVRRLTNVNAVLQRGLAGAESLFAVLDTPAERQSLVLNPAKGVALPMRRFAGAVCFENVSFQHAGQERMALNGFNLSVAQGESVVLLGPSGVGKSTVLYLLCGFDRPASGRILVDGHDLDSIDLHVLRQNISLVAQRTQLFDLSIAENIALGRPEATRAEIVAAVDRAHAAEFIAQLPNGLETPLGALGDRLSGGQRQRIAIARAFLKDAPLLLLDEATSALDQQSERAVLEGLQDLMRGRTVLMVSHAPERLLRFDRSIEMRPIL